MSRRDRKRKKQLRIIIGCFICFLLVMTVGYAAFSTDISLSAKGNIKDPSRVIQSWEAEDLTDFHSGYYRENIVSASFLNTNDVPSNVVEKWDVSSDGKGGVIAYVTVNDEETSSSGSSKYDLFIGADGGVIANENSSFLFYRFVGMKYINFNDNFDTSNATTMRGMFRTCSSISKIDVSSFDTSNVTDMASMFNMFDYTVSKPITNSLSEIVFGNKWDTSEVTTFSEMFLGNYNLTTLDVANWNTENLVKAESMFAHCYNLETLDVSNWNTSNMVTMTWMFMECYKLSELDLRRWDTSNVTNMNFAFHYCQSLKVLNLCSFDTSKVTTMRNMFNGTSSLTAIYVGDTWSTEGADTEGMFSDSALSSVTTGQCSTIN